MKKAAVPDGGRLPFVLFWPERLADEVVVRAEAFESGAVQFLPMVGVGDADDGLGSLLKGLSVEVDCSVLCHEPVDVVTGGHDTGARCEDRGNLADALVGH